MEKRENTGTREEKDKKEVLYSHIVSVSESSVRIRNYAQIHFLDFLGSNKGIKKAIDSGRFLLNNKRAKTGDYVKDGDLIEILRTKANVGVFPLEIEVLYEDDHCAILNKPSGLSVHNPYLRNLNNALGYNLKKSTTADALPAPLALHRLDALTSGLILAAKSRVFQIKAGRMFEEHSIRKSYIAILLGDLPQNGNWEEAIEKKAAQSSFRRLNVTVHPKLGQLNLVEMIPRTGRTHQLRRHSAEAGFPILGERLYAKSIPNLKGRGLFLFANKLEFTHPVSGESIYVTADPPKKFKDYFTL